MANETKPLKIEYETWNALKAMSAYLGKPMSQIVKEQIKERGVSYVQKKSAESVGFDDVKKAIAEL